MCHPSSNQLVSEHGWAHTSSSELQDFSDTYIAFMAYDKWFLEKSIEAHFCQFRFSRVRHVILHPWKKKSSSITYLDDNVLKVLHSLGNLHRQSAVPGRPKWLNGRVVRHDYYWHHPNCRPKLTSSSELQDFSDRYVAFVAYAKWF